MKTHIVFVLLLLFFLPFCEVYGHLSITRNGGVLGRGLYLAMPTLLTIIPPAYLWLPSFPPNRTPVSSLLFAEGVAGPSCCDS